MSGGVMYAVKPSLFITLSGGLSSPHLTAVTVITIGNEAKVVN